MLGRGSWRRVCRVKYRTIAPSLVKLLSRDDWSIGRSRQPEKDVMMQGVPAELAELMSACRATSRGARREHRLQLRSGRTAFSLSKDAVSDEESRLSFPLVAVTCSSPQPTTIAEAGLYGVESRKQSSPYVLRNVLASELTWSAVGGVWCERSIAQARARQERVLA